MQHYHYINSNSTTPAKKKQTLFHISLPPTTDSFALLQIVNIQLLPKSPKPHQIPRKLIPQTLLPRPCTTRVPPLPSAAPLPHRAHAAAAPRAGRPAPSAGGQRRGAARPKRKDLGGRRVRCRLMKKLKKKQLFLEVFFICGWIGFFG